MSNTKLMVNGKSYLVDVALRAVLGELNQTRSGLLWKSFVFGGSSLRTIAIPVIGWCSTSID